MPLREFADRLGKVWRVWSVTIDQAYVHELREAYLGELAQGWLCFESNAERRRLASFPEDWHLMTEGQLSALLERAKAAPRRDSGGSEATRTSF
jgi:hypothetical protein